MSLFDVVSNAAQVEGLSIRFVSKLDELAAIIFDLMNQADNLPVEELIEQVLNKTGIWKNCGMSIQRRRRAALTT